MNGDKPIEPVAGQDNTPTLESQARAQGWQAGVFNFGLAEKRERHFFNPSLIERADGLWLIVRLAQFDGQDQFGTNGLVAFRLKPGTMEPEFGRILRFMDAKEKEQFEDPRAIYYNDQIYIAACSFIWYGNGEWTGAHQVLGVFKSVPFADPENQEDWQCERVYRPEIGGNNAVVEQRPGKHEKNWSWFFHAGKLHVYYHSSPWRIAAFGSNFQDAIPYETQPGATWAHGAVRGGTPPILVNNLYWTFFHSSVPWIGRFRRYHMGAIGFDPTPPFTPRYITSEPLLTGSQVDYWLPRKPLVVFPCGARFKDNEWLITYGINDLKSGWIRIPHPDILRLAKPISGEPGEKRSGDVGASHVLSNESESGQACKSVGEPMPDENRSSDPDAPTTLPAVPVVATPDTKPNPPKTSNSQSGEARRGSGQFFDESSADPAENIGSPNFDEEVTLGDQIRKAVDFLCQLENGQASRKQRILKELRQRRLVPQAGRRR